MHELGLLIGVILATLLVMAGLLLIFRRWLARREDLIRPDWGETGAAELSQSTVNQSPAKARSRGAGGVAA